jgi:hypothetical protein
MNKSIAKLEILIQNKDLIKKKEILELPKKKYQEQSDYDSVGLVNDNPIRRSKSKIEFDGYLISTINSKNIRNNIKKQIGIETETVDKKCIICFESFSNLFK